VAIRNPSWSRDELILALDLYFRSHPNHSGGQAEIESLSIILNKLPIHVDRPDAKRFRNNNGVQMKLMNFRRFDSSYSGVGLQHSGKLEEEIWREFANDREHLHEVAEGIRAEVTFLSQDSGALSVPEDSDDGALEGKVLLRAHKVRERNPTLAKKKKQSVLREIGELRCEVCRFVFSEQYGVLGEGFIECHHTVPLSQLRPDQRTRLQDLALVCANCHRMLHRPGEQRTLSELRKIVQSIRGS